MMKQRDIKKWWRFTEYTKIPSFLSKIFLRGKCAAKQKWRANTLYLKKPTLLSYQDGKYECEHLGSRHIKSTLYQRFLN